MNLPAPAFVRAFSSLGCPELTLEETLALAERHGIAAVELRALGDTTDLPGHLGRTQGSPEALAAKLRGREGRILALDTSLGLAAPAAADREAFLAFLPWAEALHVPWLRVFDSGRPPTEAWLDEAVETMRWWRDLRRRNGWRAEVMIETHDALLTADAVNRFCAAVPGAAILWDAHNTWRGSGEDPVVTWRAIRPHVVHIHVKDSVSQPADRPAYTLVLPGHGEFSMAALRGALAGDRYAGAVSLEWERKWHPELPALDDALRAAAEHGWW